MAVCPHCGDTGAPPRGPCLLCGKEFEASAEQPPELAPIESEAETVAASAPAPLVLEPLADPGVPPELQPLDDEARATPPVDEPLTLDPVDDAVTEAPTRKLGRGKRTRTRPILKRRKTVIAPLKKKAPPAPKPHAQLQLSAHYEYTSVPGNDPPLMGILVELEATGKPLVKRSSGPVAHVILALDLSASMNHPDKYPVLRDAIGSMLDDLQAKGAADVLVSVVIFSMGAETLIKATSARRIGKAAFFGALEKNPLCFGRYTDVAGALSRAGRIAYDQAKENPSLPIRIYLLTDGQPQDFAKAAETVEKLSKVPADIHALAFGADSDVTVLQRLFAGKRGGTVKSVRRETLSSAFERVAEVAQKVVATRCRVEVNLEPGVVGGDAFRYRPARVRFPDSAFEDGKRFRSDLGTIETGRTYSLLFEVRPPESENERLTDLGVLTVQIPGATGPITKTLELTLPRSGVGGELGQVNKGVRTARDILSALNADDPETALRALRLRRTMYEQENRDPGLLHILDKSIELLETTGSLDGLSPGDYATLQAHTCTSGSEHDREFVVK